MLYTENSLMTYVSFHYHSSNKGDESMPTDIVLIKYWYDITAVRKWKEKQTEKKISDILQKIIRIVSLLLFNHIILFK